jgi:putative ABC transport system permease protein
MSYALSTLWFDRQRYLPGVFAVGFSAMLIALQVGLLLGLFSITSLPIDHNHADLWMGAPEVASVDLGRPIRESYLARMAAQPGVERCEAYVQGFAYWSMKSGASRLCMVIGSRLANDSLGAVDELSPELRDKLTEPGAVVIDRSDKEALGISKEGDKAEVSGCQVRVVGFTTGVKSLAGPYVFCSVSTGRSLLRLLPDQVTYVLGKCDSPESARQVVRRLWPEDRREKGKYDVSVFTKADFSSRSQIYWVTKTKAGYALGWAALLGLLVGAVVTYQTLYAATVASLREYAVLRALGIPRWRMAAMVMAQAFWVGVAGIAMATPVVFGLQAVIEERVPVNLRPEVLAGAAGITLVMALGSGLVALRSLRQVEPAALLR